MRTRAEWMAERIGQTTGLAVDLEGLRKSTKPDPLGELLSPTSDGVYRVSYRFPFVRLINQDRKGVSLLRRILFGDWRVGLVPAGETTVNESIHESAIARYGKRAPQRRGDALKRRKYRPMNLATVVRRRKRAGCLHRNGVPGLKGWPRRNSCALMRRRPAG